MEPRAQSEEATPTRAKREQRVFGFKLQPGDEPLLDRLNEDHRQLLLSNGTYVEKAQKLGIPVGTVRSRLNRARTALEALRQTAARAIEVEPAIN